MIKTKKFWATYLCLLQIFDGLFTWWGVKFLGHGTNAEGNPIVKYIMDNLGVVPGLVLIKGIAIVVIYYLYTHLKTKSLGLLCLVYTIVVGIWAYMFLYHNYLL
jgi:hypothetical protein